MTLHLLFWVPAVVLAWVFVGYPFLVLALGPVGMAWRGQPQGRRPRVAVVVACHDEAGRIGTRIRNIQSQDGLPPDMRLLVIADRCADETAAVAASFPGVEVLEIREGSGGRAAAHNAALRRLAVDVVVFTDADTEFAPGFLEEILRPFTDARVGCVVGRLVYRGQGSGIASSERSYFAFETRLREAEASLGLLATGTGACMAVRASLFRPLAPTHDVDFVTPLDVVFQGFRVVMATDAVAYDTPPTTVRGEWRVRIRQTARNLDGTLRRWWDWGGWRYPTVTMALLSHKFLRWMTGLFLLLILVASWSLAGDWPPYLWIAVGHSAAWGLGLLALALSSRGIRLGPLTILGAFLCASLAMLVGCLVALVGGAQVTYEAAEPASP